MAGIKALGEKKKMPLYVKIFIALFSGIVFGYILNSLGGVENAQQPLGEQQEHSHAHHHNHQGDDAGRDGGAPGRHTGPHLFEGRGHHAPVLGIGDPRGGRQGREETAKGFMHRRGMLRYDAEHHAACTGVGTCRRFGDVSSEHIKNKHFNSLICEKITKIQFKYDFLNLSISTRMRCSLRIPPYNVLRDDRKVSSDPSPICVGYTANPRT